MCMVAPFLIILFGPGLQAMSIMIEAIADEYNIPTNGPTAARRIQNQKVVAAQRAARAILRGGLPDARREELYRVRLPPPP